MAKIAREQRVKERRALKAEKKQVAAAERLAQAAAAQSVPPEDAADGADEAS